MKKTLGVALTAGCMAMAPLAMAQPSDNVTYRDIFQQENWRLQPEFSLGAAYGFTKLDDGDFDDDENAWRALATFKFNEFIGIEGSWIEFEEASASNVLGSFALDSEGTTLALILEIPFNEGFGIYAKGGRLWWDSEAEVETALFDTDEDFDGDENFWGAGLKFRLAEHLDLKLEWERFEFEIDGDEVESFQTGGIEADMDHASIGLHFTF